MALFAYVTESCWRDAETYGLADDVRRFVERVERSQSTQLFDHFPRPYLVKKKLGGRQGRLIAELRQVGEHDVAVCVAVMIRGDAEYEQHFSRDPVAYGDSHFKRLYSRADLERNIAERSASRPPPDKDPPAPIEYRYLHEAFAVRAEAEDELICETVDWVARCGEAPFKNWHPNIYESLADRIGTKLVQPGGELLPVRGRSGWSLLVRDFPEIKARVLIGLVVDENAAEVRVLRENYTALLSTESPSLDQVLRHSRRSYPALLLADGDTWMEIEKDSHANLALSREETAVLEGARRAGGGFPLFINGRAGSGKSTILQYLFSEILFFHLVNAEPANAPVYFTCNPELLRIAQRNVETVLRCSAKFWEHGSREKLLEEKKAAIASAFQEFRHFLHQLVPEADRLRLFALDRHVSYTRFKQHWARRFGQEPTALREYGPDISWHVIRSYIKGLSPDDLIDPDEYRQLDHKQITVTWEAYERVYNKVWRPDSVQLGFGNRYPEILDEFQELAGIEAL